MIKNLGTKDRAARLVMAVPLALCSVLAPLPVAVRLAAFGLPALYLFVTAVVATCTCYALFGMSTCSVTRPEGR